MRCRRHVAKFQAQAPNGSQAHTHIQHTHIRTCAADTERERTRRIVDICLKRNRSIKQNPSSVRKREREAERESSRVDNRTSLCTQLLEHSLLDCSPPSPLLPQQSRLTKKGSPTMNLPCPASTGRCSFLSKTKGSLEVERE